MDTAYTTRARELRDIYTSLTMKYLTQDERLDVLLTLKHTVKVSEWQIEMWCLFNIKMGRALERFIYWRVI